MEKEIDTTNKFLVGRQLDDIVFLVKIPNRIPRIDALLFAAYLVALAEETDGEFQAILEAVQNT